MKAIIRNYSGASLSSVEIRNVPVDFKQPENDVDNEALLEAIKRRLGSNESVELTDNDYAKVYAKAIESKGFVRCSMSEIPTWYSPEAEARYAKLRGEIT